ncbi:MAG: plastocyanin/azurin family copper-binding protein [Candidatus Rokuibacteriota bacterium]
MLRRRSLLQAGGLALAGLAVPHLGRSARIIEIQMKSDLLGADVWFDPVGVWIEPGTAIRWVVAENVHTTTAYHPKNGSHSLRIPEGAEPWDSGFLVKKGDHFQATLTVEGVYDYYCMPHEAAGMVGRIVVGRPGGPGTLAFDYFAGRPGTDSWKPVPEAARKAFPSIERIMAERTVRRTEP